MKRNLIILIVFTLALSCTLPKTKVTQQGSEGLLKVNIQPEDAEIWIDGVFLGIAVDYNPEDKYISLTSGLHTIEIKKDGYETVYRDIYAGHSMQTLAVTLTPHP